VAGEIKASGTSGHLVRDVRLGGSRCHRSRGRGTDSGMHLPQRAAKSF
jgi:hypothetical protein